MPQLSDFLLCLAIAVAVGFVFAIAFSVALRKRPVPWYEDDRSDESRMHGIDPDERWKPSEY
ncbi:MAG: hypothetical protein NT069_32845 [Planctomycetota bacterium]|nr:hypothetical protein [Planctomycetota bacterium]